MSGRRILIDYLAYELAGLTMTRNGSGRRILIDYLADELAGREVSMAAATFSISVKRTGSTWLLLLALALASGLTSCDGGPTDAQQADDTGPLPGLIISDPTAAPAGAGAFAAVRARGSAAAARNVVYVSASPGTLPGADTIIITNPANGDTRTVSPLDGGFDPVRFEAEPDDEVEILIRYPGGGTTRYVFRVPARRRPRIVRTAPPRDATHVALSVKVDLIFTEPVDRSTVTPETVRLELNNEPVAGTLLLSDDGLKAEFTPAGLLQRETTYALVITTGVLDLDGEPLAEEVGATFTTGVSVEVQLCAKQVVVEEINGIQEPWLIEDAGWTGPAINSTEPGCGVSDSEWAPHGTFTYTPEGPEFEWKFEGEGFVTPWVSGIYHQYVLVYYPDPWPGTNLVCLAGSGDPFITEPWIGVPFTGDSLTLSGSHDFGMDLNDGKIWIVRRDWVDCTGREVNDPPWANLYRVPRLTNDRNDDGEADATETRRECYPRCDYGDGWLVYDWLFETALINYRYTPGNPVP
jgi:hypothetical protein